VNAGTSAARYCPLGHPEKPAYLQVRLLHDGYDFSPGQIFVVQTEGRALGAISLGTDPGNTHISFDSIKDATVKAKDIGCALNLAAWPEIWRSRPRRS